MSSARRPRSATLSRSIIIVYGPDSSGGLGVEMTYSTAVSTALAVAAILATETRAMDGSMKLVLEAQRSYVHCVNGRVSVEQWDEEQMRVRRGSNVCQLRSFTSSSSAQGWATSNFPSGRCSC